MTLIHLSDPLADVLEEAVPGVFPLVRVDNPVEVEVPHLDVPVSRPRAEHRLVLVHTQTLDGVVVSLSHREYNKYQRIFRLNDLP